MNPQNPPQQFNNGQPLTPDQVTAARASLGINPQNPLQTSASSWDTFDKAVGKTQPQDQGEGYLGNLLSTPQRIWQDYQNAAQGMGTAITQGADRMSSGIQDLGTGIGKGNLGQAMSGLGQIGTGVAGSALGTAGNAVGAIFAPIGEAAKGLVPQTGNEWVDSATTGAGAGAALAGPAGALVGGALGLGFHAVNAAEQWLYQQPKFAQFAQQNPDVVPMVNNALNVVLAALGEQKLGQSKTDILNAPLSEVPGKVGQNLLDTAKLTGIPQLVGSLPSVKNMIQTPITMAKDAATPIDENVMKVLQNPMDTTEGTLKNMFNQANKAITTTGEATPFDVAGKTNFGKAMDILNTNLKDAGQKMQAVLEEKGSTPVDIKPVVDAYSSQMMDRLGTALDSEGNFVDAAGRKSIIANSPADTRLLRSMREQIVGLGQNPSLQQVNDVVDSLQGELYKAPLKGPEAINSQTAGFVKQIVGQLNGEAKAVGGADYQAANDTYARLSGLKQDLNSKMGADYKNAGAWTKRIFSPSDGGIKTLVSNLEQETGVPIFHDATLAKFAMDAVGDPRAQSLLQQGLDVKSKGFIKSAMDYLQSKLEDPQGKALRTIQGAKESPGGKAQGEIPPTTDTSKINTAERFQIRQDIADHLYGEGAPVKNQRADIILGPPASGKSTYAEPIAQKYGSLVVDSDMAKKYLPEYNGGQGAGVVHNESGDIIDRMLLPKAIQNGDNITMPLVGKTLANVQNIIDVLNEKGYAVHLHLFDLPPEEANARAITRAEKTGRVVNSDYILNQVGTKPLENFNTLKNDPGVVSATHYSNDVPQGTPPKLVEEQAPGLRELSGHQIQGMVNDINSGGITFNMSQGKSMAGEQAYAVSVYPNRAEVFDTNTFSIHKLKDFLKENYKLLADPKNNLGGWVDNGKVYLDISRLYTSKEKAMLAGKEFNQIAITDLSKIPNDFEHAFINTGGSGDKLNLTDSQIQSKLKDIGD